MSKRKKKNPTKEKVESITRSAFSKLDKKLLLKVFINFILVFSVYRILVDLGERYENPLILEITVYSYIVITGILSILFIIWNRGLSNDVPTKEQLNDEMTDEEKEKFITDLITSRKKAKIVLLYLIPFIFTLLLDAIVLVFFSSLA